jgi:ribokinase
VPGANFALTEARVVRVVHRLPAGSLVVLQAEVPHRIIQGAVGAAAEVGARVVLNLAPYTPLPAAILADCDPLVVNETEAAAMLGRSVTGLDDALAGAVELTAAARSVVITLGALGAVWADGAASGRVPARSVAEVVDTTGAGDAFTGALCSRLAAGADLASAVELGVFAGSFAVTREGAQASYPGVADVEAAAADAD